MALATGIFAASGIVSGLPLLSRFGLIVVVVAFPWRFNRTRAPAASRLSLTDAPAVPALRIQKLHPLDTD